MDKVGSGNGRQPPSGSQKKPKSMAHATVAVVDDDPAIREALRSLLGSVGLKTEMFELRAGILWPARIWERSTASGARCEAPGAKAGSTSTRS